MNSTTTVSLKSYPSHMDYPRFAFSRHSNSAGAPLPHIPKRSTSLSSNGSQTISITTPPRVPSPPAALVIHPPTPPRADSPLTSTEDAAPHASGSGSGSSSDAPVQFVVHRQRRGRSGTKAPLPNAMRRPEESTPTPSVFRATNQERVAWPAQRSPTVPDSPADGTPRPPPPSSLGWAGSRLRPTAGPVTTMSAPDAPSAAAAAAKQAQEQTQAARAVSVSVPASVASELGRKKSGEPLKSSLKSRRTVVRGDLSVVTGAGGGAASKSEPSTPTHIKSVHFDAQLEHVKLFLAEQKPLAVSRDGSPTTDTSGTESDFPEFIYGRGAEEEEKKKKTLVLHAVNVRARQDMEREADVSLQEVKLSADGACVNGQVRVRNIAFEKWVAVRFTFDAWQTTSEVTAKYVETEGGAGGFDVFGFTIRLSDLLARIEEKTLWMAVRYVVSEREMWDNNGGANYEVRFTKVAVPSPSPSPSPRSKTGAEAQEQKEKGREVGLADLRTKLEKVASGQETLGGYLARQRPRARHESRSPTSPGVSPSPSLSPFSVSPSPSGENFNLHANTPLAARYDFSQSLRSPWTRSSASPSVSSGAASPHARNSTYPTTIPHFPGNQFYASTSVATMTTTSTPTPTQATAYQAAMRTRFMEQAAVLARGSPRLLDPDDEICAVPYYAGSDTEDTPVPGGRTPMVFSRQRGRNHQRGYFDLGFSADGRKTLPAAFRDEEGATPRYNSVDTYRLPVSGSASVETVKLASSPTAISPVPLPEVPRATGWQIERGGSEESTPSATSTSESSCGSSPSGSPRDEGPMALFSFGIRPPAEARSSSSSAGSSGGADDYNVFLNKFCFYTGPDSLLGVQQDALQRSHSASSVEEFLASPGRNYYLTSAQTPPRSSSFDDVAYMSTGSAGSGAATPTARSMVESESAQRLSLAY